MVLQLIILILVLALFVGSFVLAWLSDSKVFFMAAFLFLMFSGILIQSSGGLIIDSRPINIEVTPIVYEDVVVPLTDSSLYLFSQACFWIGLVMLAWTGLSSAFGSNKKPSPFSF